jgi:hypothetical protein
VVAEIALGVGPELVAALAVVEDLDGALETGMSNNGILLLPQPLSMRPAARRPAAARPPRRPDGVA